jgi:photosystem II stability/assembly factor-like uncharacterized protein
LEVQQRMKVDRRLIRLAVLAAAALAAGPTATASAGIWTPVASGTTANITAIDDVSPSVLVYGTGSGQILKNGVLKTSNLGYTINDVAFNPSGTVGLAVASNGRLLRSSDGGETWPVKLLTNTSYSQTSVCSSTPGGPVPKTYTPSGNLNAVSWASDLVAYIAVADIGVVEKTTDGGVTWNDVSRRADNTCKLDTGADLLTDVQAVPGSDIVWFIDNSFGDRYISGDGLASVPAHQSLQSAINCVGERPRLALDLENPSRAFAVDRCGGGLAFGFTSDGGSTWDLSQDYFAGDGGTLSGLNGVAVAGGSAVAVGNAGAILVDNDGRRAYFQRAATANDWLSVDKRDATHAVVGGSGGALVATDQATAIPDLVAPAGTVSGVTTTTVGTPTTFTANVADNAGGSGIDPASLAWNATGVPAATGNPVTLTFPSPGFYVVAVSFRDLAGNAATASTSVTVAAAAPSTPPPVITGPIIPARKSTTTSVPGAKISFGVPNTCVKAGSTFKVTLTWKKQKRKGNKFVKVRRADFYVGTKRAKIDNKAPFTQTLTVKASTKKGSTVTVKARAYIKVTKGKSPTKSISSKIKVCA